MLTQATKIFLPIGLLSLILAVVYALSSGELVGVMLFVFVSLVAGALAVVVGGSKGEPAVMTLGAEGPEAIAERLPQPGGGGWPLLAAVAVALLMVSFVVGALAAFAGLAVAAVAGVGWMARLAGEHSGREISLLPLGLPVVGLFAIASLMFFMSRMLLAVSERGSWILALAVAAVILLIAAVVSVRPHMSSQSLLGVLVVGGLLMIGGGLVAAAKGERHIEAHGAGHHSEKEAGGEAHADEDGATDEAGAEDHSDDAPAEEDGESRGGAQDEGGRVPAGAEEAGPRPLRVVARDIAFDVPEIALVAGKPSRIEFDNADDKVPHNIGIYKTKTAGPEEKIFVGQITTGPAVVTYEFDPPPAGTYHFRCDVHPNMEGKVVVS